MQSIASTNSVHGLWFPSLSKIRFAYEDKVQAQKMAKALLALPPVVWDTMLGGTEQRAVGCG